MIFTLFKKLFSPILKFIHPNNVDGRSIHSQFNINESDLNQDKMIARNVGLSIPFYPKLIDHLEADHRHLLQLYVQIERNVKNRKYSLISDQLAGFKEDFVAHLEAENIKFYGFLEQRFKDQSQEFASLRRFRKEMRTIERTVIKFLDHWIEYNVDSTSVNEFKAQYESIGEALVKRIESEEKELYTMYQA